MTFNRLGTSPNNEGGYTYDNSKNPLLVQHIMGNNSPWGRYPSPMNPATFASFPAASAIAAVLGGVVVPDPQASNWNLLLFGQKFPNDHVFAVALPGKAPINAGYICEVMGNDIAYPTAHAKSKAICEDSLKEAVDWSLADRLFDAFSAFLRF